MMQLIGGRFVNNVFQNMLILRMKNVSWNLQTHATLSTQPAQEKTSVKKGIIAKKIPKRVFLDENKEYSWCCCGYSKKQPFCDGSHSKEPTELKPIRFKPKKSGHYFLCRCKQTNNRPYCDLTHIKTFIPESLRTMLKIQL